MTRVIKRIGEREYYYDQTSSRPKGSKKVVTKSVYVGPVSPLRRGPRLRDMVGQLLGGAADGIARAVVGKLGKPGDAKRARAQGMDKRSVEANHEHWIAERQKEVDAWTKERQRAIASGEHAERVASLLQNVSEPTEPQPPSEPPSSEGPGTSSSP